MKKSLGLLLSFVLIVSSPNVLACTADGKEGFLPDNDLWISVEVRDANMTEAEFKKITNTIADLYRPIMKEKGGNLDMRANWKSGTVNAFAKRSWFGNKWIVQMYGGLARHELVTQDAYAMVVCHEIGHHIGGTPKNSFPNNWASVEGQSDYWGAMKCFRKYAELDNNVQVMKNVDVDITAKEKCADNFKLAEERAICERTAMAGYSLASLLRSLRKDPDAPKLDFSKPDAKVVTSTFTSHPAAQCRLDTYFAGAICDRGHDEDVSNSDANKGVCNRMVGDTEGVRPLCWFKPKS